MSRANAQELLAALGAEGAPASVHALRTRLGIGKDGAHRAIHVLVRRGLATQARYGHYRITAEGRAWLASGRNVNRGRHPRSPRETRTGTLRGRLWLVMRMQRRFGIADLLQTAEAAGGRSSARRYVKALERGGYLRRLPGPANGAGTWVLLRNTGPRPPSVNKAESAVYDPNTGDTHALRRSA